MSETPVPVSKKLRKRVSIPRLKRWQPIIITWIDAITFSEPAHSEDDFKCPIRKSIGHFIKRTPEAISIAMEDDREHKDNESDCQTVTSIPISMIRKITILQPMVQETNDSSTAQG